MLLMDWVVVLGSMMVMDYFGVLNLWPGALVILFSRMEVAGGI